LGAIGAGVFGGEEGWKRRRGSMAREGKIF